jgi:hypothetical protein
MGLLTKETDAIQMPQPTRLQAHPDGARRLQPKQTDCNIQARQDGRDTIHHEPRLSIYQDRARQDRPKM